MVCLPCARNPCLRFVKGYVVDWDAQKAVWDGIFSEEVFGVRYIRSRYPFAAIIKFTDACYVRSTPQKHPCLSQSLHSIFLIFKTSTINLCLKNTNLNPIWGVHVRFLWELVHFYKRTDTIFISFSAATLAPHGDLFKVLGLPAPECTVLVDTGFSFTHVLPILQGYVVWEAVRRQCSYFPSTSYLANFLIQAWHWW